MILGIKDISLALAFRPETTFTHANIVCKHVLQLVASVAFYHRLALIEMLKIGLC